MTQKKSQRSVSCSQSFRSPWYKPERSMWIQFNTFQRSDDRDANRWACETGSRGSNGSFQQWESETLRAVSASLESADELVAQLFRCAGLHHDEHRVPGANGRLSVRHNDVAVALERDDHAMFGQPQVGQALLVSG